MSRSLKIETIEKEVVGSAIQKHGFIFDYQRVILVAAVMMTAFDCLQQNISHSFYVLPFSINCFLLDDFIFLDASSHLYNSLCLSVCPSVRMSVRHN